MQVPGGAVLEMQVQVWAAQTTFDCFPGWTPALAPLPLRPQGAKSE